MFKAKAEGSDSSCGLLFQNCLRSPKHQHKLSERLPQGSSATSHRKQPPEKKSVKKIIQSSNSKRLAEENRDRSKQEPKDRPKKEPKKKDQKAAIIPSKQPQQHILKSHPKIMAHFQAPKNVTTPIPIKTFKPLTVAKPAPQKQLLVLSKPQPSSQYFIGMKVEQSHSSLSPKKISNVQFSYTNRKLQDSLEITPETNAPELVRQSSMHQLERKNSEILRKECLRRAESDNQICASINSIHEAHQKESHILKPGDKYQKAKSLKNLVQYRHFNELAPKSTVSSGDKPSASDISGFSDVIETVNLFKCNDGKPNSFSLDRLAVPKG